MYVSPADTPPIANVSASANTMSPPPELNVRSPVVVIVVDAPSSVIVVSAIVTSPFESSAPLAVIVPEAVIAAAVSVPVSVGDAENTRFPQVPVS